jgi:hypothetical protein
MSQHTGVTRRRLLAAGGGLAAAALVGGFAEPANADVPGSAHFDLTQPSYDLFRDAGLFQQTVMQSFTFDNVNRRLFAAQVTNGSASADRGDLCVSQLSFAGELLGHMFLTGFGHGVSIGVEPVGSTSYLWTEVDSVSARAPSCAASRSFPAPRWITRRPRWRSTSPSRASTPSPARPIRSTNGW